MLYIARWKITLSLVLCALGLLYAAPNVVGPQTQSWLEAHMPSILPSKAMNLGLDLRGGSHLLLQVDMNTALADRMNALTDEARRALREANVGYKDLGATGNNLTLTLRDAGQRDAANTALKKIEQGVDVAITTDGKVTVSMNEARLRDFKTKALDQSMEIIRRRVDETGTREPSIQRQGDDRILVQLPGVDDPTRMKRLIGQTAKLNFRFVDSTTPNAVAGSVPAAGAELLQDTTDPKNYWNVSRRVIVGGDTLTDAQPSFDQTGRPVVSFKFDNIGGRRFGDATRDKVGKLFAIVLDDKVISAPVIREPILGGSGQISGNFTVQGAQDLALLLRAGALPAPLTVLEERTVGPGLGADSIKAGAYACIGGLVLVIIFMLVIYGRFGVYANIALLFNMVFIVALLSLLQATLTLPGIAGIVLTMGMAVDANVLVFERMREEARHGKSVVAAVDAGYARALSAIIDANVTTLIAAFLLYLFGTGPVKGFAVTLSIGIITSLFSALLLTRILIAYWIKQKRPKVLPI